MKLVHEITSRIQTKYYQSCPNMTIMPTLFIRPRKIHCGQGPITIPGKCKVNNRNLQQQKHTADAEIQFLRKTNSLAQALQQIL
jgi:hypothetical protein